MAKPKNTQKTQTNGKHSTGDLFAAELAAQEPLATLKAIIRGESGTESKSITPLPPVPSVLPYAKDVVGDALEDWGLTARVVKLDKALAEKWLARLIPGQRTLKNQNLQRLINAVEEGFWELNGETIILSREGNLIQGRHRCETVIRTGIPILTVVLWGIPESAYLTLDNGSKRTGGDALAYVNAPNYTCASATTTLLIRFMMDPSMATSVSRCTLKIQQVYNDYKAQIDASVKVANALDRKLNAFTPATAAFAHLLFSQVNPEAADAFFESLRTGSNLTEKSPVMVLRDYALKHRGRLEPRKQVALLINAWNAYRKGAKSVKLAVIEWSPDQAFPSIAD